ncbi:MAG: VanZ family protein [Devosia sp.]|uniref:VanZ family protein n=1 Tax=Devosia sp. TaxID=1871048 RepID=UPI001AC4FE55|nr:VanZ family protein [Devosia sp.]
MLRRLLPILAWLLLAAIAFVTLSPIGFRPESGLSPNYERFAAFAAVGLMFALAYPRHIWLVLLLVLGAAIAFEALQLVTAGRHGRLWDLVVKLLGGGIGIAAGAVLRWVWTRMVGLGDATSPGLTIRPCSSPPGHPRESGDLCFGRRHRKRRFPLSRE